MQNGTKPKRLFNKNFILLWQGQFVSSLGNHIVMVGQMLWIKSTLGLATLMAIPTIIWSLTYAAFGLLSGAIADTYPRKKIIVLCDLLSGIGQLFLVILMFMYADKIWLIYAVILVVCVFQGMLSSLFMPAIQAAIPDIVPEEKLEKANSVKSSSQQIATLLGQGIGGYLFRLFGAPMLFLIDCVTYLFSAFSESFITIPYKSNSTPRSTLREESARQITQIKEGLTYINSQSGLKKLMILFIAIHFFSAPFLILLPFFVEDYLLMGAEWYGFMMAGMGGGALLGSVIAGFVPIPRHSKGATALFCIIMKGILGSLLGFIHAPIVALTVFTLIGTFGAFFNIIFYTAVQLSTPSELRGRVFSVMDTISIGLMPLGMGITSIVADFTGRKVPVMFLCAGLIVMVWSVYNLTKRDSRRFLNY